MSWETVEPLHSSISQQTNKKKYWKISPRLSGTSTSVANYEKKGTISFIGGTNTNMENEQKKNGMRQLQREI